MLVLFEFFLIIHIRRLLAILAKEDLTWDLNKFLFGSNAIQKREKQFCS